MAVDSIAGAFGIQDSSKTLSLAKGSALSSEAESPFHDALAAVTAANDPVKIRNAAKDFESLMIGQILKAAHESSEGGWLGDDDDQAGSMAVELADERFAQTIAAGGSLGISKLVEKFLEKSPKTASSVQIQAQSASSEDR